MERKIIFKLYEDFRTKIISEEHIINNHIKICSLIRNSGINETNKNSYLLKDLINQGWFGIFIYNELNLYLTYIKLNKFKRFILLIIYFLNLDIKIYLN